MKSKLIVILCGLAMFLSGIFLGGKLHERKMYKNGEALCMEVAIHPLDNAMCLMQIYNFLDMLNGKH